MTITRYTPSTDLPEYLRVEECAAWLDISPGLVRELTKRGELPHRRFGRLVRIHREALAALKGGGRA